MSRVIVCGWHTPDYAHWLQPLPADLDGLGIDRDFVAVPKPEGWSWERVTRLQAEQAPLAMLRHPDRTVVCVAVVCGVLRRLDGLADIRGDVAVHMTARFRRHGGFKFRVRSGTIVRSLPPAHVCLSRHGRTVASRRHGPRSTKARSPLPWDTRPGSRSRIWTSAIAPSRATGSRTRLFCTTARRDTLGRSPAGESGSPDITEQQRSDPFLRCTI